MSLSRNKTLFFYCEIEDNFSSRLILFLLHFVFFLSRFKEKDNRNFMQDTYDFIFRQIDISLRETGDGDVSVNKKMKNFINTFHAIILDLEKWNHINPEDKTKKLQKYLICNDKYGLLASYFDRYLIYLRNNNLNFFTESVNKHKF